MVKLGAGSKKGSVMIYFIIVVIVIVLVALIYLVLHYSTNSHSSNSKIGSSNLTSSELSSVAAQKGDSSVCELAKTVKDAETCKVYYQRDLRNDSYCSEISSGNLMTYYGVVGNRSLNATVSMKDFCWTTFGWRIGMNYCQNVSDSQAKEICLDSRGGWFK